MNISKQAAVTGGGIPSPEQLEKINRLTKTPLREEQVYVFSVRLCDDRTDRDYERFDTEALPALAALFVGKTGIVDHNWSAEKQVARIFDASVLTQSDCSFIRAWAYTLRNEKNASFIEEIDAGIKKEVSVGCAMSERRCSVCGSLYGTCAHRKGERYEDVLCTAVLRGPTDAYEFSFVAVPAQREAGVLKAWKGGEGMTLKELAQQNDAAATEYELLTRQAALGRQYESALRSDVVRLGLLLEAGMDEPVLRAIADKLGCDELRALQQSLTCKAESLYPAVSQLSGQNGTPLCVETEYLI